MTKPTLERLEYPIKELPSGDALSLQAFRIRGEKPGPHIHIQASVHGAEVQGNAVIYELLSFFSKTSFRGSLTFIPMANPIGLSHKVGTYTQGRYNPQSGQNYNRNYFDITNQDKEVCEFDLEDFTKRHEPLLEEKNFEDLSLIYKQYIIKCLDQVKAHFSSYGLNEDLKLNLTLQKIAATADIVLDLHTGPVATRYLYAGEYTKNKVVDFPFPHTLTIPNEFDGAMDEATFMPWVSLSEYLKKIGLIGSFPFNFEAYTVELGSEEVISFKEAKKDVARILTLLAKRGVISEKEIEKDLADELLNEDQFVTNLEDYKQYNATIGGLFEYSLKPGDHFEKGDILGHFLNFKGLSSIEKIPDCKTSLVANEKGIVINRNPSSVVSEGTPLYQVFTNFSKR